MYSEWIVGIWNSYNSGRGISTTDMWWFQEQQQCFHSSIFSIYAYFFIGLQFNAASNVIVYAGLNTQISILFLIKFVLILYRLIGTGKHTLKFHEIHSSNENHKLFIFRLSSFHFDLFWGSDSPYFTSYYWNRCEGLMYKRIGVRWFYNRYKYSWSPSLTVNEKSKANMNIESPVFVRKKEQFYFHHLLIFSILSWNRGGRGLYSGKSECLVSPKNYEFYDITLKKTIVGSDIRVAKTFWK